VATRAQESDYYGNMKLIQSRDEVTSPDVTTVSHAISRTHKR